MGGRPASQPGLGGGSQPCAVEGQPSDILVVCSDRGPFDQLWFGSSASGHCNVGDMSASYVLGGPGKGTWLWGFGRGSQAEEVTSLVALGSVTDCCQGDVCYPRFEPVPLDRIGLSRPAYPSCSLPPFWETLKSTHPGQLDWGLELLSPCGTGGIIQNPQVGVTVAAE